MSDKHQNQASAAQAQQMRMGASPVPPAHKGDAPAPETVLEAPRYLPGTLPMNILKNSPDAWSGEGDGTQGVKPPELVPAKVIRANVDEPFVPMAGAERPAPHTDK